MRSEAIAQSELLRKVFVPQNKRKSLRKHWDELVEPLVQQMDLAVKFDIRRNIINLLPSYALTNTEVGETEESLYEGRLTKAVEYLQAYLCGFKVADCLAILRFDDIFVQSFRITDIKKLEGDNLSRAIGRLSGRKGTTRNAIENTTRTRFLINGKDIHLLGSYENIALARDAIGSLILGSPISKVQKHLSVVNRKMKERL